MKMTKLAPWNWFKKEQENEGRMVPAQRAGREGGGYPTSLFELQKEIDNVFNNFFRDFGLGAPARFHNGGGFVPLMTHREWIKPTVDIAATDKEYTVSLELPGVEERDVELEVVGDTLTIKGEKKQEHEEQEKDYYCVERSYGSFQRVLTLPEDATSDGIEATFRKGVLRIRIPRKVPAESQRKQIEVKVS